MKRKNICKITTAIGFVIGLTFAIIFKIPLACFTWMLGGFIIGKLYE